MSQLDSQGVVGAEPEVLFFLAPDVAEDAFSGLPDPGPELHLPGMNGSLAPEHRDPSSQTMAAFADVRDVAGDKSELGDFSALLDSFAQFLDGDQEGLADALGDAAADLPDETLFSLGGTLATEADSNVWAAPPPPPPSPAPAVLAPALAGTSGSLNRSTSSSSGVPSGPALPQPSACIGITLSSSHDGDLGDMHLDNTSEASGCLEGGSGGVPTRTSDRRKVYSQSSSSSNSFASSGAPTCAASGEADVRGPSLLDKLKNLVNGSGASSASSASAGGTTMPATPSQASLDTAVEAQKESPMPSFSEGRAPLGGAPEATYSGLLLEDGAGEEGSRCPSEVDRATQHAVKSAQVMGCGNSVEKQKGDGAKKDDGEEESGSGDEDQQRQQRLMRNRQSALQSRQRRKMYVTELEQRCRMLEVQLGQMRQIVAMTALENGALRDQVLRLQQQLPSYTQARTPSQKQAQDETQASSPGSPSLPPQLPPGTVTATASTLDNGSLSSVPHSPVTAPSHSNATSQPRVSGVSGSQGGLLGASKEGVAGGLGSTSVAVQHGAEPAVLESGPLQSGPLLRSPLLAACLALHLSLVVPPAAFSPCTMSASRLLTSVLACLFLLHSAPSRGPSPVYPLRPCGPPLVWQLEGQGLGAGGAGRPVSSWLVEAGAAEKRRAAALLLPRQPLPLIPLAQLCQHVTPVLVT